jgi:cytochrome bd-type quinol oxidase subunit 1
MCQCSSVPRFFFLGLGLGAYLGKFTVSGMFLNPFVVILATSHVVVGALMLVTCIRLTLRAYRLLDGQQGDLATHLVSEQASV